MTAARSVVLVALLSAAAPPETTAQVRDGRAGPGPFIPQTALRVLLQNRDALSLTKGQALTLELKDAELQERMRPLLASLGRAGTAGRERSGSDRGPREGAATQGDASGEMGPGGGGGGRKGGGGMGGGMGAGGGANGPRRAGGPPDAGGAPARSRDPDELLAELEALDRAAAESVEPVFTEAQRPAVKALLARRAEAIVRRRAEERPRSPAPPAREGEPPLGPASRP
jgi:hypothetical protein